MTDQKGVTMCYPLALIQLGVNENEIDPKMARRMVNLFNMCIQYIYMEYSYNVYTGIPLTEQNRAHAVSLLSHFQRRIFQRSFVCRDRASKYFQHHAILSG